MALGTNYRRNYGREDAAIAGRIQQAREIGDELISKFGIATDHAYALGARVVLKKITMQEAENEAQKFSEPSQP